MMGQYEWEEQWNRNNADHLKEIDDKKIAGNRNRWSVYQGEGEERLRTSRCVAVLWEALTKMIDWNRAVTVG